MADRRSPTASVRLEWDRRPEAPASPALLDVTARVNPGGRVSAGEFNGRLIWGDNLPVLQAVVPELAGRVALCYADPPFLSGNQFRARVGRGEDSRRPENWETTEGYADSWPDADSYLNMLLPRLQAMHRLLAPTGVFALHLDWHASAYGRLLLDEIFGPERLLNEVVWLYHGPSPIRSAFKRKHDTLLIYARSDDHVFHADAVRVPYDSSTVRTFASSPRAGFGRRPDLARGKVPEDWWYFPVVARLHRERTGYPTQKPEALLERLIRAFTSPGEWVADVFCGSGTTPAVASRLGRRWLACDASRLAVHTTHRRLLLQPEAGAYTLEQARHPEDEPPLRPRLALHSEGRKVTAALEFSPLDSGEVASALDEIDLWEIDWEHDGRTFSSQAQAVRGWREAALPTRLEHVYDRSGHHVVKLRLADRYGRLAWAHSTVDIA